MAEIRSRIVQHMLCGACIVIIELGAKNLSSVAPLRAPRQFHRGRKGEVIHASNSLSRCLMQAAHYTYAYSNLVSIENVLHSPRIISFRTKDKRVHCANDITSLKPSILGQSTVQIHFDIQ